MYKQNKGKCFNFFVTKQRVHAPRMSFAWRSTLWAARHGEKLENAPLPPESAPTQFIGSSDKWIFLIGFQFLPPVGRRCAKGISPKARPLMILEKNSRKKAKIKTP